MSMMDLYKHEQAIEAMKEAKETKAQLVEYMDELNSLMFILTYYIETGEALNPEVYGIKPNEEEDLND